MIRVSPIGRARRAVVVLAAAAVASTTAIGAQAAPDETDATDAVAEDVVFDLTDGPDLLEVVAPGGDHDGPTGEAPGGPGPDTWTVEAQTYEIMTGPDEDLLVTIDADLWVPSSATAATPAPAILTTHGFGNTKSSGEQLANAAYFASHGYVVLSYTSQGFGDSSSCIALDGLDYDVRNARALVDELAALDFVAQEAPGDPRVGMVGGSYGGGLMAGVASTDPRMDALAIGRTWHALAFSLDPNNWIADPADAWDLDHWEQGVFKREWTSLFFGLGASSPATGAGGCDPVTQQLEFGPDTSCPGFLPEVCRIYARVSTTGDAAESDRETLGRSSFATMLDEVKAPTIFLQGLPDTLFTPTESAAGFEALRERDVETAMVWHSGGHGGYVARDGVGEAYGGGFDDSPEQQAEFATSYLPRRTLQWFERHVRGEDVDTGPAFAWFRDDVEVDLAATGGTAAPAFGASDDFPVGDETVLALDPNTSALVNVGSLVGGTASMFNPPGGLPAAYSETANFSSPGQPGDQPAFEVPGQNIAFTSAPFTVDTELVGVPRLRLNLAGVAPVDLRFFGKLYDVDPDGNATLIRRQVAPARIPGDVAAAGPVDVHLVGSVHAFPAGHSLRVVLATTDLAYYNEVVPNQITLSSTPDAPSLLSVHLLTTVDDTPAPAPTSTPTAGAAPTPSVPGTPVPSAAGPATPARGSLPATGGGAALLGVLALGAAAATRRR